MGVEQYIIGTPPDLAGRVCQGFVCEQYFYGDELCDEANVTYLQFDGKWFRLYFEPGLIFWRSNVDVPAPWEVPEEQWRYPHVDLGKTADILGRTLLRYDMWPGRDSSRVSFEFDNEKRIFVNSRRSGSTMAVEDGGSARELPR